jgi:hypothetical protein
VKYLHTAAAVAFFTLAAMFYKAVTAVLCKAIAMCRESGMSIINGENNSKILQICF